MEKLQLTLTENDAGQRLDKAITTLAPELTRTRLQALIAEGQVTINGALLTDGSRKVKGGEKIEILIPEAEPSHLIAQAIALDIVYEDAEFLVINKPPGMTVHPAPGSPDKTLVNALLAHCGDSLSGIGGVARPGIVHRIDKETSGLLVVAKNDAAHQSLAAQLNERILKRTYLALCYGAPAPKTGTITGNIGRSPKNRQKMAVLKEGGKFARTHYTVQETFTAGGKIIASLLQCELDTGRTHQIRVHLSHIGHSIVGDQVYGGGAAKLAPFKKALDEVTFSALSQFNRQALHAYRLALNHPKTGKPMSFEADLPADMAELLSLFQ